MAGQGSRYEDPARGGSPASDEREHGDERAEPPGPWSSLAGLLQRIDNAFSRTFTAAAMAEDGTRELALEQLEESDPEATADPDENADDP